MVFEVDKYYKHVNGELIVVRGIVHTYAYGTVGVTESPEGQAGFVGLKASNTVGWQEISCEAWCDIAIRKHK